MNICTLLSLQFIMALALPVWSEEPPRPLEIQSAPPPAVGKVAPALNAQDATGQTVTVSDGKASWTVVAFLSTRCPCTARYLTRLATTVRQFEKHSVRLVGINSNANEQPEDAAAFARDQKLGFPFLKDTDGSVARALRPQSTPEVYVLDAKRRVRYRGAIDDSLYGDDIRHTYLRDALTALTSGKPLKIRETRTNGCAIFLRKTRPK